MWVVTLDGKSINEYSGKIKGHVDELADVEVLVHHEEYVDALLEGLSSDYASTIFVIKSKKHTPSITKIETLLYGHETRLTRYSKDELVISYPSLNYTQRLLAPKYL